MRLIDADALTKGIEDIYGKDVDWALQELIDNASAIEPQGAGIAKVILENPSLPIYAWVDCEVVADDSGQWLGDVGFAEVKEIVFWERWDICYTITKDDCEDLEQHLFDNADEYFPNAAGIEPLIDKEIDKYICALPWKKVILIHVGTPDSVRYIKMPKCEVK